MELKYSKTVKDKYGSFVDIDVVNQGGKTFIELDTYDNDGDGFKPVLGVDEVDELIEILKEAREVLSRGRDINE